MKKMCFLMLTLIVLGAASANAQVRIGGTDSPHASAVLDLNPNTGNANGGLALPRVALANDSSKLNGVKPQPGTVVYNTASTLAGEGTYVWTKVDGDGTGMVTLDKIQTAKADSGLILSSNGESLTWIDPGLTWGGDSGVTLTNTVSGAQPSLGLVKYFSAVSTYKIPARTTIRFSVTGGERSDYCFSTCDDVVIWRNAYWFDAKNNDNQAHELGTVTCYHIQ
jgi:hypothetical protein